jgi:hypothetical protein
VGQKLVKQDIRTERGVLAYARGQLIEDDAVLLNGWEDYVVGRDTKEARAVLAEITGDVPEEPPKQTRASRSAGTSTTSTEE